MLEGHLKIIIQGYGAILTNKVATTTNNCSRYNGLHIIILSACQIVASFIRKDRKYPRYAGQLNCIYPSLFKRGGMGDKIGGL